LGRSPAIRKGKRIILRYLDQTDAAAMNMALNNAKNVCEYYAAHGDTAVIELFFYRPGLSMMVAGESPVADRI
jgi:hypothetical protein